MVNFCEFNTYAAKAYCAIHGELEEKNLGDITKVDENKLEEFNMICGGSPCQDFSLIGKQEGATWYCEDCGEYYNPLTVHFSKRECCPNPLCRSKNLDKSRSSLLVEWLRVIRANKPSFGVYENVKNIVGAKFKDSFEMFIKELNEYGYNTYYKILNAKDYGSVQKRERLYLVIIRKDIDNGKFTFPESFTSTNRLQSIMDENVDDRYYLTNKQIENIYKWKAYQRPFKRICGTNSICPTITARGAGEYHSGMVLYSDKLEYDTNCENSDDVSNIEYIKNIKPRVLTEKEAFRVMGFSDDDYEKVKNAGISPREQYRQAGNSICVDALFYIYKQIFDAMPYLFDDLRLSSYFSGIGAFEKALNMLYDEIINH